MIFYYFFIDFSKNLYNPQYRWLKLGLNIDYIQHTDDRSWLSDWVTAFSGFRTIQECTSEQLDIICSTSVDDVNNLTTKFKNGSIVKMAFLSKFNPSTLLIISDKSITYTSVPLFNCTRAFGVLIKYETVSM